MTDVEAGWEVELDASLERAMLAHVSSKYGAQLQRRAWRAKERAAHSRPLSTKVVHPRVLVELPPGVKKGKVTSR